MDIDHIRLNLDNNSMMALKLIIALIMYGVALELKVEDFKSLMKNPRGLMAGFLSQLVIFPIFTLALIFLIHLRPSIALGLVIIAACPSGSLANLMTSLVRGNVALSVGLTSASALLSMIVTPFMLIFLGEKIPGAQALLSEVHLGHSEVLERVFMLMGIPMILGMTTAKIFPHFCQKIQKTMKKISVGFLLFFIIAAFVANYQHFVNYMHMIVGIVFVLNVLVLLSGFIAAKILGLSDYNTRAVTVVMGLKNSSLGLALVFQFFGGLGGAAMVVAWWGVSQIAIGLITIQLWKYIDSKRIIT